MIKSTPIRFSKHIIVKVCRPSVETSLNYGEHPFFTDLLNLSQEQKDFFERVFVKEEDIFRGCIFDWESMNKLILRGLFEGVQAFEPFPVLDVPDQVNLECLAL